MKQKNPKDVNPYEVQKSLFVRMFTETKKQKKWKRKNPKDVNPYETQKLRP